MATGNDNDCNSDEIKSNEGGSWWQSWGKSLVDTVKEKTSSTYEMVQKDLSEFYQTIQTDTAHVVVDTATKVQDQVKVAKDGSDEQSSTQSAFKQGFASILTSVSESLKTLAQEESPAPSEAGTGISMASPVYDRRQAKIFQIQTEIGTYCNEPEGSKKEFESWQESFDFDSRRPEMSDLLVKVPEIRAIYSKLVPSVVSHSIFWQRYFYRIQQFELREERRAALVARAETASLHEEELNWDSDDAEEPNELEFEGKLETADAVNTEAEMANVGEATPIVPKDAQSKIETEDEGGKSGGNKSDENIPSLDSVDVQTNKPTIVDDSHSSFEILSPTRSVQKDATSDSLLTWSLESEEIQGFSEHFASEGRPRSPPSNRSSPAKEDSSSGSSVEVIAKVEIEPVSSCADDGREASSLGSAEGNMEKLPVKGLEEMRSDQLETASTGSWISVDDEIKVRKSRKEKFISDKGSDTSLPKSPDSIRNSGSSTSSAVLVEKSECKEDDDDDDVDIDLDEDINEEELQKIMEKIKNKSGDLDDENDWEDWE